MQPKFSDLRIRDLARAGVPVVLLLLAVAWLLARYVEPAPPRAITISTGSETGAYFGIGKQYADILARAGVTLNVVKSAGSAENFARLNDPASGVDVALIQGGIKDDKETSGLVSLGRMFFEPVWIFYRGDTEIDTLAALKGKRVATGITGSGTHILAEKLLSKSGIEPGAITELSLGVKESAVALQTGEADAIFLTLAPGTPIIEDLLRDPTVRLMSLAQAEAYTRLFPFLTRIVLPRGVVDIARNIPGQDVQLIANDAALVAHANLHPALVGLLAEAAQEVHAGGGLFHRMGTFPKAADPEFELSDDAGRYYKSGHPFLRRYLPFWIANFIERSALILLPVLTILYPVARAIPFIYNWRIRRRFLRYFAKLKQMERLLDRQPTPDQLTGLKAELASIDASVALLQVPVDHTDRFYELRAAIELVRGRIASRA